MATKLKNLKIRKVDFVDEGANPDAHIGMLKRKDKAGEQTAEKSREKNFSFTKRLFNFIGKAAGMNQEEIDCAMDEIQKGDSVSFNEKINETKNRKIADEIWDVCYALQSSLCSILNDEDMDSTSAATAMKESLDEFTALAKESIESWSGGKAVNIVKNEEVTEADMEIMKSAAMRLQAEIQKADKETKKSEETDEDGTGNNNPKGDGEEMKIDKSKMTDAERAFLESIEKRYGTEEGDESAGNTSAEPTAAEPTAAEPAVKSKTPQEDKTTAEQDNGDAAVYKGLHPAVQAELEELKKFKEAAEDREFNQIAEKYAIIGKKKEELVPMFKSLRAAGGTAYKDMIAVLDNAVDVVEKSGAFTEVGKSGHGSASTGQAEEKIAAIAKGYMEKDASLDYTLAIAKAWENNPELMAEYEEEADL